MSIILTDRQMQNGSENRELGLASVNRWLTWLNSMDDQTEQRTTEGGLTNGAGPGQAELG